MRRTGDAAVLSSPGDHAPHVCEGGSEPTSGAPKPARAAGANVFATREFVQIVAKAFGGSYRPFEIAVAGSGPERQFFALEFRERLGLRSFTMAPCSHYASPGWDGTLEPSTLQGIFDQLTGRRVRKFSWKVCFDQDDLAAGLSRLPLETRRDSTHVIRLDPDYDRIFAGYGPNHRNKVRRSRASGLSVRRAEDPPTVAAYHRIHTELAAQKGTYEYIYPLSLFLDLVRLPYCRLLVAEIDGRVVGGCVFFEDQDSIVYWHGASDRDYSTSFPSRRILDEAVQWGCSAGARFLNMGGSAGIASLERFKSEWGARPELNWNFEWRNVLWERISRVRRSLPSAIRSRYSEARRLNETH